MGTRAAGARLERMKASPLWAGDRFQNVHPVLPNLRDPTVPMPSLKDFMCGGERRVPRGPLPSMSPLEQVGSETAKRLAGHLAWTLHDADRDRWRAYSDRSGVGSACVSFRDCRTEAFSTRARSASRNAARRCRDSLARSLRSSRLSHHSRPGQDPRAVRHVPWSRRASGVLGVRRSASSSSTGGSPIRCRIRMLY